MQPRLKRCAGLAFRAVKFKWHSASFCVQVLTKLGVQEFLPSNDALTAFEGNLCRQVQAATALHCGCVSRSKLYPRTKA